MFTVLDLAQGYIQIPLSKEAREKSAFITPDETGEFTRVYFGLKNAPFYFCKLIQKVLGPLNNTVKFYLHDFLITATTWLEMKEKLILVFNALNKANLTLKLSKCKFLKSEVEYLGFNLKKWNKANRIKIRKY